MGSSSSTPAFGLDVYDWRATVTHYREHGVPQVVASNGCPALLMPMHPHLEVGIGSRMIRRFWNSGVPWQTIGRFGGNCARVPVWALWRAVGDSRTAVEQFDFFKPGTWKWQTAVGQDRTMPCEQLLERLYHQACRGTLQ